MRYESNNNTSITIPFMNFLIYKTHKNYELLKLKCNKNIYVRTSLKKLN